MATTDGSNDVIQMIADVNWDLITTCSSQFIQQAQEKILSSSQDCQRERWVFTYNNYDRTINYLQYFRILHQSSYLGLRNRSRRNSPPARLFGVQPIEEIEPCKETTKGSISAEANGSSVANYKYCSKSRCAQILANPVALNQSKYCRYNRLNWNLLVLKDL